MQGRTVQEPLQLFQKFGNMCTQVMTVDPVDPTMIFCALKLETRADEEQS